MCRIFLEALKEVEAAGGQVLMPACPVMDSGVMATVQDPEGAVVQLWQAGTCAGAEIVNEPQTWCWSELSTRDINGARSYYEKVFGWQYEVFSEDPLYVEIFNDGKLHAGMMPMPADVPTGVPAHWHIYLNVGDVASTLERARTLGAEVIKDVFEVAQGPMAVLRDPTGAVFSIIALHNPDE